MVEHRSVSQYNQYTKCPYAYYLQRVQRVWEKPAAWFPQGTAVHKAAEEWEKSDRTMSLEDAQDVFRESYAESASEYTEVTPNLNYWFASGRYRGEADLERRYGLGLEQVERYVDYYNEMAPWEVVWITPEGQPAIELEFNIDLDGVLVRGFIDQVITDLEANAVRVRDIKSGNKPGDDFQLATYAVAVNDKYGTEITTGDYWMGRKGKPTKVYELGDWTKERLTEEFHKVDEGIRAGDFPAIPEDSKCMFCTVSASCTFKA